MAGVLDRLGRHRSDALATLEMLESYRQQTERACADFENCAAVLEYIAFFVELVQRGDLECERIARELADGPRPSHVDILRALARECAAEQRRCLLFRDRWINKPLPCEHVRPLLNDISITTRDQLTAFADLDNIANELDEQIAARLKPEERTFDRRSLFTRLFRS